MISDRIMDRFLGISSSKPLEVAEGGGDELNEEEILWTNEVTEKETVRTIFGRNSGILSALHGAKPHEVMYRKPIVPATARMGTEIPRPHLPERERSKKLRHQSAPVNVPLLSMAISKERNKKFLEDRNLDEEMDEKILPPHEIVSIGSGVSPKTTFSVLEGAGRTLKGRDLRQVRNAVWHRTGFLD